MIIVNNVKGELNEPTDNIILKAAKKAGVKNAKGGFIYRRALDARKETPFFVYSVGFNVDMQANPKKDIAVPAIYILPIVTGSLPLNSRPIVIGYGPAGIFAAYLLALRGYNPIVLEKGADLDTRNKKVAQFFSGGALDINTNVQFGEGGAGTYSDGKLTTRVNSPSCRFILEKLVEFGAPSEILWLAKPHIGTDKLGQVVKNIRLETIHLGGEFHFNSEVTDIEIKNGKLISLTVNNSDKYPCSVAILAVGHSARNIYSMLGAKNITMQPKAFSVGVRIEHLQSEVNKSLYGSYADSPFLGSADYNVSYRQGDRGIYSFCMCPGGQVVAAASEEGHLVVNGMSNLARNGKNANSALCVSVTPHDYGSSIFAGVEFQRKLEREAFVAGGANYSAPIQKVGDFISDNQTKSLGRVEPSYPRNTVLSNLNNVLPSFVCDNLKIGLNKFKGMHSFFGDDDALLTAVETRTSAPIRVYRNETLQSPDAEGLYPCGEGAGYAGGIMSAAADGLRVAEQILSVFKPEVKK